jgi:energy-coupling factor transporter ATP-binding protein EcfA2
VSVGKETATILDGMSSIVPQARLRAEIDALAQVAGSVRFGLATEARSDRRSRRDHLLRVLNRYIEPRLANPDAPLLVAVFGPTGSGKSTIVNTLAGRPISRTGVLRPTTREAVVWVHERHAAAITAVLRESGPFEIVTEDHPILRSLAIIDTPDIDSIAEEHRQQTTAILEAADVAIAVTTPQRYADAVPWDVLADLTERRLDLIVVMNRASRRSSGAVSDLAGLLRDARVGEVTSVDDVTVVQEQRVRADGRLHGVALRRLARRLESLAADHAGVAMRGLAGSGQHVVAVAREMAVAVHTQLSEAAALEAVLDDAVAAQQAEIAVRLEKGDLVRDEVVARWQRLVGLSDLADIVSRGVARLRSIVGPRTVISDERVARVETEVRQELLELGMRRAMRARTAVEIAWSAAPAGQALVDAVDIDVAGVRASLASSIEDWQAEVVALVAAAGEGRFRLAKAATIGINAAATLLLLGVFASTGGLTGAEMGIAAGAAAAQQTVLERLFGSAAAGRLAKSARTLLAERLGGAVDQITQPYRTALGDAADDVSVAHELRDAADRVESALAGYLDE